ncbi:hypothetical protein [Glaciibacter psychrotolerans]|uniref:Asparagine synthase n=1 Tax=Glaciibacter psychrotolerans TaxID=670054 RepID=A0A7Z0EFF9_9MICO|nr:hypothetical protein [Leifsonia psychrotolerans]NYJ19967.1 hypothetical protein [Leifsonia psychrotolerans]
MWFRRKKPVSKPFDFSTLPQAAPASLEDMVSESIMLARFAARMALKNQIIIGVLRNSRAYDPADYTDAARDVLDEIVEESEESARLAWEEREAAEGRVALSKHQHDYTEGDTANLKRREDVHSTVASRLQALRDDDDYIAGFIESARDAAWTDIALAISAKLDRDWPTLASDGHGVELDTGPEYAQHRAKRLRQLSRDLTQLSREAKRTK